MLYPSACHSIDALLGGGFPTGAVSHIFGEPGSGKTTAAIQLAINVIRFEKRVLFIAAEKFSADRFTQIAGADAINLSKKLLVFEVNSFAEQRVTLGRVKRVAQENVGLICLDTATTHYRLEQSKDTEGALRHELANQLLLLLGLARKYDLAVLVTNQVYVNGVTEEILPVAGYLIDNLSSIVLQFAKSERGRGCAILKKHPTQPSEMSASFKITGHGLTDV
jgi:DNA repair protein RadB